ncbi:WD40 repeat-containing protein [[Leptolyngbya] sp. PCC 7376]|uniref:WD40 repeat domain-containing protein n=1 Tax=[Leptolyngbya] sp. PCC 7376 TaxID=111781 RepID=UPI00029EC771|nr:WD40 repeat domain-containing protein [[Leptolyngbya] sp. PCC 7376]AFY37567.1 WD40 repeat-containing protein [[Leptolyngbya] sp. PCC 7376]
MAEDIHFTVEQYNSLEQLRDTIAIYQGEFALIFAHCNYRFLRDRLINALLETPDLNLEVIELQPDTISLLDALAQQGNLSHRNDIDGLLIRGFERIEKLPELLTAINQVRESLKRDYPMPMVCWLTQDAFREVMNSAPDLESWSVGVGFVANAQELNRFVNSTYEIYLNNLEGRIPKKQSFTVELATLLKPELSLIQENLLAQFEQKTIACFYTLFGITCQRIYQPELAIEHYQKAIELYQELGDRFSIGCVYYFLSRIYYSRAFSDQEYVSYISPDRLKRLIEEQQQPHSFWQQSYGYINQSIEAWQSCGRDDAITWAFPRWQRILSYLEKWDELETYARRSLALLENQQSKSSRKLYLKTQFWLGDALLFQGKNQQAKQYLDPVVRELEDENFTYALARQSLAQIYYEEQKLEGALALLEEAEESLDSESLSRAHVRLLELKRQILFELGRYLEAYRAKEQKQLAEYEYSFKSFIGATRIQQRRDEDGMSVAIRASGRGEDVEKLVGWITGIEHAVTVIYGYSGVGKSSLVNAGLIPELAKSQRSAPNGYVQVTFRSYGDWQDNLLSELLNKVPLDKGDLGGSNISQPIEDPPQPPLTKGDLGGSNPQSSQQTNSENIRLSEDPPSPPALERGEKVEASLSKGGIVQSAAQPLRDPPQPPLLKEGANTEVPLDKGDLGGSNPQNSVQTDRQGLGLNEDPPQSSFGRGENIEEQIFEVLKSCDQKSQLVVLIFDQFEEFFFTYEQETERQQFFELLGRLTNETTHVNLVFSLRRDYMHFLLGRDQLKRGNQIIDLLSRDNGYELKNFSRDEAIQVFQRLTERTSFQPDQGLIAVVVDDLLDPTTERVRPIELQIIGRQLEETAGGITTLAEYQQQASIKGVKEKQSPKAVLVRSYLDAVVRDCGATDNQKLAYQLMFLLTDKQGRRPIKSFDELETGIQQLGQGTENVEMILQILVLSDLVSEVQDRDGETTKYQLVHDYLVEYVRAIEEQDFEVLFQAEVAKREAAEKSLADIQLEVSTAKELKQNLEQENRRSVRNLKVTSVLSAVAIIVAGIAGVSAKVSQNQQKLAKTETEWEQREQQGILLSKKFEVSPFQRIETTLESIALAKELVSKAHEKEHIQYSVYSPISTLQKNLNQLRTKNLLKGHIESVSDIRFSPDGQTLASASADGTVRLWNLQGEELAVLEGHTDVVWEVRFSPDGQTFASASSDNTLRLWNLKGEELAVLEGHADVVLDVRFSPDGQTLASVSSDNMVRLWNLEGEELAVLQGHTDEVIEVRFSPDGQTLASASVDNTIRLWNLQGEELVTLQGHISEVYGVRFSPDGQTLASASFDNTVRLWNLKGEELVVLQGHTDQVWEVRFSPDGQTLASASFDNTVRLWNLKGEELAVLQGHTARVWDVSFSPDGQILASAAEDKTVRLWNLKGEELAVLEGHADEVWDVRFSPDGQTLASGSPDNTVRLWSFGGEASVVLLGYTGRVRFSPDGQTLASASLDNAVKLWDFQRKQSITLQGHTDLVWDIRFSPDSRTLASASADNTVRLWNLQREEFAILQGHTDRVSEIRFSPDGQTLASASDDSTIRLWNLQGEELAILQNHTNVVFDVRFSPNGQTIASSSRDNTVRLWNLQGDELVVFQGHTSGIGNIRFSPDGQILASASDDNTVRLWNIKGQSIAVLKGHTNEVIKVRFSPDGQILASISRDRTVRLWNLKGEELAVFQGHTDEVWNIAFSPDGETIASASKDGTVRLWNLQGDELAVFQGHTDRVFDVRFSPDGKTIASASGDDTVRLWKMETLDEMIARGCRYLQDYLLYSRDAEDKEEYRQMCQEYFL